MPELLKIHPNVPCRAAIQIEAAITRPRSYCLELSYVITGHVEELSLPPATAAKPVDELWRHSCFEAFIRTTQTEYYEFNFSPTGAWAAYRFSDYRRGQSVAAIPVPVITARSDPDRYSLQATLQLESLYVREHLQWHVGLSAVIEDKSGHLSYWALAHAADKPDFHRPESFVREISPVVSS
jgi:hypothetical protein